jgi:hypothetical protein
MTIDGDDAVIGCTLFNDIIKIYKKRSADVVIGRMYQTYRLQAHYRYPVNFYNPRGKKSVRKDSNVWQHIRTFKKYLFDSLDICDLKVSRSDNILINDVISNNWLPDCTDYAMMIPIVEMSVNPIQMEYFTYYHDRLATEPQRKIIKESCIAAIMEKKPKNITNYFKKRKLFLPNLNKIEIDITYECNLKCFACNRSCSQSPTNERMEVSDIERFVFESINLDKKWELINILGGEPTLHPDFEQIVRCIHEEYLSVYSPHTILQITSNGFSAQTRDILEKLKHKYPNLIIDTNTNSIYKLR